MEAKELWEKACKQILSDIAKAFSDEKNINKAKSESDKIVFSAIAKKIQDFPIPECPETDKFNFIPIEYINRSALEKCRDYFVVTEDGNIIQAHYSMITETEGDFFGKDTNEFYKVVKIDLNYKPIGKPC